MVGSEVSFALVGSDTLGRSLLGPATYLQLRAEADARADGYRLLLIGTGMPLDGTVVADRLSIRQNAISYGVSADIFIYLGESIAGVFGERVAYVGAVLVDPAVDFGRAATIRYDLRPDMDMYEIEMAPPPAAIVPPGEVGPAAPITAISKRLDQVRPSAAAEAEPPGPAATGHPGPSAPVLTAPTESTEAPIAPPSRIEPDLDFSAYEEATFRERMIESAVWPEIFTLIAVFTLSLLAFFSRNSRVRWIAPSAALVYVGFIDGSFLPVSHITGGVEVGPSFYVNDLKLLVVVGFAVVTVLLFGRLVCGNLCPFGTVQDLLQRFVPERFQYLPRSSIDARLRFAKYVFLALILLAAAAGSEMTLFQYFEPFGTLFFLQPLGILGLILLASLIASAIVPRFYCRYVCPLGAALGIGSLLALFRIKRVDACSSCHICEQSCPVGAISGPKISFTECLRCGVCEEKLMMRVGACRLTSGGPAPGQLKSRQPAVAK